MRRRRGPSEMEALTSTATEPDQFGELRCVLP